MNVHLPRPVAAYLAAEKAKDSARLAQCFHSDAVVRDEGNRYPGITAIEAWHRDANTRFRYVVEPLDAAVDGQTVLVHTRVTGDFPGSPVEVGCRFQIDGDRIRSLEIAP